MTTLSATIPTSSTPSTPIQARPRVIRTIRPESGSWRTAVAAPTAIGISWPPGRRAGTRAFAGGSTALGTGRRERFARPERAFECRSGFLRDRRFARWRRGGARCERSRRRPSAASDRGRFSAIFTATRRWAERERGLVSTSSGPGATARRVSSSASGSRPQTQTGSSGGQTQPGALGEELLDRPILERVEGDRAEATAERKHVPGRRQRVLERVELAVDGDPDRLEGALGRVAAAEAGRGRHPGLDRVDQLGGGRERPAADDLAGDPAGVALLAEATQRPARSATPATR